MTVRSFGLNRTGLCYSPLGEGAENLELMRRLDEQCTRTPFYGVLRMLRQAQHKWRRIRVAWGMS